MACCYTRTDTQRIVSLLEAQAKEIAVLKRVLGEVLEIMMDENEPDDDGLPLLEPMPAEKEADFQKKLQTRLGK